MRLLHNFHCENCGKNDERFIDSDTRQVPCECGYVMHRLIGMPRIALEGITGAFPDAHDRWARIREENASIKAKRNGDY